MEKGEVMFDDGRGVGGFGPHDCHAQIAREDRCRILGTFGLHSVATGAGNVLVSVPE